MEKNLRVISEDLYSVCFCSCSKQLIKYTENITCPYILLCSLRCWIISRLTIHPVLNGTVPVFLCYVPAVPSF